jgi:hypothetical protein
MWIVLNLDKINLCPCTNMIVGESRALFLCGAHTLASSCPRMNIYDTWSVSVAGGRR